MEFNPHHHPLRHGYVGTGGLSALDARRELRDTVAALPQVDGLATHVMGLADFGKIAASLLLEKGWITGSMQNAAGAMCLHGALREVGRQVERHDTDAHLASTVFTARGKSMNWNDREAGSADAVIAALEEAPIADTEMTEQFGPCWPQMVAMVRHLYDNPGVAGGMAEYKRHQFYTVGMLINAALQIAAPVEHTPWGEYAARAVEYGRVAVPVLGMAHSSHADLTGGIIPALIGLALREALVISPRGRDLYDALTAEYRYGIGPLHAGDRAFAGADRPGGASVPYTEYMLAQVPDLDTLLRRTRRPTMRIGHSSEDGTYYYVSDHSGAIFQGLPHGYSIAVDPAVDGTAVQYKITQTPDLASLKNAPTPPWHEDESYQAFAKKFLADDYTWAKAEFTVTQTPETSAAIRALLLGAPTAPPKLNITDIT